MPEKRRDCCLLAAIKLYRTQRGSQLLQVDSFRREHVLAHTRRAVMRPAAADDRRLTSCGNETHAGEPRDPGSVFSVRQHQFKLHVVSGRVHKLYVCIKQK